MRLNHTVLFILPMVLLLSSCRNINNTALSVTVKHQLAAYPAQRLVDIYKAFFQGFFGPAHLITDSNSAAKYIKQELAEAVDFEDYDYQPLPPDGKFVRVNLRLIKEGKISLEDFAAAFVKSAKPVSRTDIKKWKKQWPRILTEIEKQRPNIPHFQEDKAFIDSLLAKDEYVVHHSDEFIARYHPHYRLISAEQLKAINH
ncbi:MAG: hypothetical protein A2173_08815 [Planctomycetes bacterium RBG_13_44_8b]|nr:MAG: hypothetical protein A2173_08815 [Planctomycetes bacterium RBG_13_44_8b]